MTDPYFTDAIKFVDQMSSMPADDAARYVFVRYRIADPQFKEAMIAALTMALLVARRRAAV